MRIHSCRKETTSEILKIMTVKTMKVRWIRNRRSSSFKRPSKRFIECRVTTKMSLVKPRENELNLWRKCKNWRLKTSVWKLKVVANFPVTNQSTKNTRTSCGRQMKTLPPFWLDSPNLTSSWRRPLRSVKMERHLANLTQSAVELRA